MCRGGQAAQAEDDWVERPEQRDRSSALALGTKLPRVCTHQAVPTRESTVTVASASASPRKTLAMLPKLLAEAKSTVWVW